MQRPVEKAAPDIVTMSGVRFRWRGARAFSLAIDDFALPAKERVLLVGPSGAGKSTFLSLLCGIVSPQAGRLEVLGTDMTKLSGAARDHFRAEHFGIIFQMFNLLPYGSILDNVLLPLSFARKRRARAGLNGSIEAEARAPACEPRPRSGRASRALRGQLERWPAAARGGGARAHRAA